MLVGTVYFYDDAMEIVNEMDMEAYEDLKDEEFTELVAQLAASKVTLNAFSHNHHNRKETVLYSENKKQT